MQLQPWQSIGLACTALAAVPLFQQSPSRLEEPQAETLRRVAPADEPVRDAAAESSEWQARLSVQDLGAREVEFDALVTRAAEDAAFRAELEGWAQSAQGGEFAWTCRLALREVKAREAAGAAGAPQDPFEALRRHGFPFQELRIDPFGGGLPGSGQVQRFRFGQPFGPGQSGGAGVFRAPGSSGNGGASSQSQSLSLEMGPDGVKVRVKKNENGQETSEEYTAKTMDELLAAHPELSGQLGGASGAMILGGGNGTPHVFRFGLPDFQLQPDLGGAVRTDRLGVYLDAQESEPGAGLEIAAVQQGSLAEKLGLQRGERLLKLNGRELSSRDDISAELGRRDARDPIEVEVRAADGKVVTRTWTPSAKGTQIAPLPGARKV